MSRNEIYGFGLDYRDKLTIDPFDQVFERFDVFLDSGLRKDVVLLNSFQKLGHAPVAVGFELFELIFGQVFDIDLLNVNVLSNAKERQSDFLKRQPAEDGDRSTHFCRCIRSEKL